MFKKSASPTGWETDSAERRSYYFYFTGQNAIYTLVSSFLTTYMMFQGVDLKKSAAIMVAVKVWDAVNDVLFGVIFDSVKFKSGKKYIPWLRISAVGIPVTTVLMFAIPKGSGESVKLAWFAIAYILWDTAYTLCDAPIYGIITSMTANQDERSSMLSYKGIWGGVGSGFATVAATVLVSEYIHSNYTVVAICVAIFSAAVMLPALFKLRERHTGEYDEQFTVKRMLKYLFSNKYLLIYYLGFFFYSALNVSASLNLFVSFYIFHNSQFSLFVSAINVVPQLIIALFMPKILRKIDKMRFYELSALVFVVLSVITWGCGYSSMTVYIILTTLRGVPLGVIGVLMFMFTPDCAEYGKYKTQTEANGITFSIQTFMAKLTGAISGALGMFLLGLKSTGWVNVEVENFEQLRAKNISQSSHALNVLWFIYVMIPAIGCAAAFIIWKFYKLRDRDVEVMAQCNAGLISRNEAEEKLAGRY